MVLCESGNIFLTWKYKKKHPSWYPWRFCSWFQSCFKFQKVINIYIYIRTYSYERNTNILSYIYTRTTIPSAQTLQPLNLFWSLPPNPPQWERVVPFKQLGHWATTWWWISSWWLNQSIWKTLVELDHFPRVRGENAQNCLSCHHLVDSNQRGGCHFPAIWKQMPHVKLGSIFHKFRGENICSATWPIRTTGTKNISHRIHLVPQTTSIFYGCFNWMLPNHYIKNDCFTKHPWKKWLFGVPGIYKYIYPDLVCLVKQSFFM